MADRIPSLKHSSVHLFFHGYCGFRWYCQLCELGIFRIYPPRFLVEHCNRW